ncbi:hypothetical protein L917_13811 [Phytophthora nicotianae]|uniref:Uncharacterized protein n=1 Tax=Phytophthora nicotianae TaxID=4792 RepID=W2KR37_PHYNI|nr:hypothetical protein L917_13811 [Phytophthora nicotianae]
MVKQVMNRIFHGSGSRYFQTFERKRGAARLDYLDYYWDGMDVTHPYPRLRYVRGCDSTQTF